MMWDLFSIATVEVTREKNVKSVSVEPLRSRTPRAYKAARRAWIGAEALGVCACVACLLPKSRPWVTQGNTVVDGLMNQMKKTIAVQHNRQKSPETTINETYQ